MLITSLVYNNGFRVLNNFKGQKGIIRKMFTKISKEGAKVQCKSSV